MIIQENRSRKPVNYWGVWENLERELQPLLDRFGLIPQEKDFRSVERMDLLAAINRHHGGLRALRIKLGVDKLKKCRICGEVVHMDDLPNKGSYGTGKICKPCSSNRRKEVYLTWEGLVAARLRGIRHRSKKNSIAYNLTKNWCLDRLNEIGYACELTGIPFIRYEEKDTTLSGNKHAMSFDRVDSSKGYTKDNVRFCINILNISLNCLSDDEYADMVIKFLTKKGYRISQPKII